MEPLTFEQAREAVLREIAPRAATAAAMETISLDAALGRVLAEPLVADRDYPPVARSVRDGFAVQAASIPGELRVIGEVRAGGDPFTGSVGPGEAVAIMTGAPMPAGADAVVMVEHVTELDGGARIQALRGVLPGENFNPQGCEARAGDRLVEPGELLDYTDIALAANYGMAHLAVFRQPRVAVLATGDEVIPIGEQPLPYQVRNSNTAAVASQVRRAGGIPVPLDVARDTLASTRAQIAEGFAQADLVLMTGGVSAGKYDLVEQVLREDFGAVFFFDRVRIQPGQPLVFGAAAAPGKYFFGLPGNPASAMVTFELFARAALERMAGVRTPTLPLSWAKLAQPFHHRPGLTRFLPARLENGNLTPLRWAGSSDVGAMARANAYLVADPENASYAAGDWIRVLLK